MVRTRSSGQAPRPASPPSAMTSASASTLARAPLAVEDRRDQANSSSRRDTGFGSSKGRSHSQQEQDGGTGEGQGGGLKGRPGRPPSGRPGGGTSESNSRSAMIDISNPLNTANEDPSSSSPTKSTFLSGFNLSSNIDILSLPDPPTPDAAPLATSVADKARARSKKKRRQSSPIRSTPSNLNSSGDDNNSEDYPSIRGILAEDCNVGESNRLRRGAAGSRKRKVRNSLCHIPSPVDPPPPLSLPVESAPKAAAPSSNSDEATAGVAKKDSVPLLDSDSKEKSGPKSKRTSIVYDDDEPTLSRKRRKSRRSILLPSDEVDNLEEDRPKSKEGDFFRGLMSYKRDSKHGRASDRNGPGSAPTARKGRTINKGDEAGKSNNESEREKLRRMVREYLALPESERSASYQAAAIESMSNYPLVPPVEKMKREKAKGPKSGRDIDLNWTSSPGTEKGAEVAQSREAGNSSRSKDGVPYIPTMEDRRAMLLKLGPVVETMERRKKEEVDAAQVATGCTVEKTRRGKYKYFDRTGSVVRPAEYQERYLKMLEETRESKQNALASAAKEGSPKVQDDSDNCDTDMSIGEDSSSPSSSCDAHEEDEPHSVDRRSADCSPGNSQPALPTSSATRRGAFPSPAMLLPLPSREESSSDPELAAAEHRLWSAIDSALAEYSSDVLAIRRARQTGGGEEAVASVSE